MNDEIVASVAPVAPRKRHKQVAVETMAPDTHKVLNEILFQQGFLHWSDVIAFGKASKECQAISLQHRNVALQPLLKHLEGMIKTDHHHYCGKLLAPASKRICKCPYNPNSDTGGSGMMKQALVGLDPRYKKGYRKWTITEKCRGMVEFISTVVSNVQREFDFDDPSNPNKLPRCAGNPCGWELGWGFEHGTDFLHAHPMRGSLALFISVLCMAESRLSSGDDYEFEDAFLGIGPIDPGGSSFGQAVAEMLSETLPLRDEDLEGFIRGLYPSKGTMTLLGPLVAKVELAAPLFQWVPPTNFASRLSSLPTPLEAIEQAAELWMSSHHHK